LAYAAAVDLELRLTGPPRAHAAAQAREVGPLACQPRQEVLELRQLDLHLALERARPLREDVEDEGAAVDHLALAALLEVALLGGGRLCALAHRKDVTPAPRMRWAV